MPVDFHTALRSQISMVKRISFTPSYPATDAEALGLIVSNFFQQDGLAILRTAQYALEDANLHGQSGEVAAWADELEKELAPDPDEPIDDATRKALFATLRGHYGKELPRAERLAKLSVLVGRPVLSLSKGAPMPLTNGEARRVFDILGAV